MEEVKICDYCGMELAEDEGAYVDDELLCDDCVADHCITCDHCGTTLIRPCSGRAKNRCVYLLFDRHSTGRKRE